MDGIPVINQTNIQTTHPNVQCKLSQFDPSYLLALGLRLARGNGVEGGQKNGPTKIMIPTYSNQMQEVNINIFQPSDPTTVNRILQGFLWWQFIFHFFVEFVIINGRE